MTPGLLESQERILAMRLMGVMGVMGVMELMRGQREDY
jgi:hypothetical protein